MDKLKLSIAFFAIAVLTAAPGCRKGHRQDAAEPLGATQKTTAWWNPVQQADYSGRSRSGGRSASPS